MTLTIRTALVTGAAGFVGSTLVDRLLTDGWQVAGVDSFDPFYPRSVKERNIALACSWAEFELHEVDTRDQAAMVGLARDVRPRVVFDLAARAGVRPSIADPAAYVDTNVRGLQNTLTAAAEVGARIVFASSSSVYGDDPRRPFQEDQLRVQPASPYGATKIAGEALVRAHRAVRGLPIAIARLFTVYGPRQRPDLAIAGFARRLLAGEPVPLFADGAALRDYTYVDDVVEALVRLAGVDDPEVVVNIGSERPIRTSQVVDELERALGITAERRLLPAQLGDVAATHADVSRARTLLHWSPQMPFEDGIARYCRWLREQPDVQPETGSRPSDGEGRPGAR